MWYYARNGQQGGPVPEASLRQMFTNGMLAPSDLVWREGLAQWQTAAGTLGTPMEPPVAVETQAAPVAGQAPGSVGPGSGGRPMLGYRAGSLEVRYGGFWIRVLAVLIDFVILVVLTAILSPFVRESGIVQIAIYWLYDAILTSKTGGTLGKHAMGVRVRVDDGHEDTSGHISFARATGRHFANYLSCIALCIGYVMVAFTERNRGLHDMMAGTVVVRTR